MTENTKRRRCAEDYEALMVEHATSGLTLRAFADLKGIRPMTLYAWHRKLRPRSRSSAGERSSRVLPVEIIDRPEVGSSCAAAPTDLRFEVTVPGDRVITIPEGFDAAELRRLLAALDA